MSYLVELGKIKPSDIFFSGFKKAEDFPVEETTISEYLDPTLGYMEGAPILTPKERALGHNIGQVLNLVDPGGVAGMVGGVVEAPIKAAPKVGINLVSKSKKVPRHLEGSLKVAAQEYASKWGKGIFKDLKKTDIRFDGMMDYGEYGKRALFTIVKKGHPSEGLTFSGPRIEKVLKVGMGKGKSKIFKVRPGQLSHFDIFESLPADLQADVEAGYMVGDKFVTKATLEKPSKLLPRSEMVDVVSPLTESIEGKVKDLTEAAKKGHEKVFRKGLSTFTERQPLSKVEIVPETRVSSYSPKRKSIVLKEGREIKDLPHELIGEYGTDVIPIQRHYEPYIWDKASPLLKMHIQDRWGRTYLNSGYSGKDLIRQLARELTNETHTKAAFDNPFFTLGILESKPGFIELVNSNQRALLNLGPKDQTPFMKMLKEGTNKLGEKYWGPEVHSKVSKFLETIEKAPGAKSTKAVEYSLPREIVEEHHKFPLSPTMWKDKKGNIDWDSWAEAFDLNLKEMTNPETPLTETLSKKAHDVAHKEKGWMTRTEALKNLKKEKLEVLPREVEEVSREEIQAGRKASQAEWSKKVLDKIPAGTQLLIKDLIENAVAGNKEATSKLVNALAQRGHNFKDCWTIYKCMELIKNI